MLGLMPPDLPGAGAEIDRNVGVGKDLGLIIQGAGKIFRVKHATSESKEKDGGSRLCSRLHRPE